MEEIKFPWGKLIILGVTKTFSIGLDIIFPEKETDEKGAYLKSGSGMYYVLKGRGFCGEKIIKEGDILKIKKNQAINLENRSSHNLIVLTVYMPPYNENNIGYIQ